MTFVVLAEDFITSMAAHFSLIGRIHSDKHDSRSRISARLDDFIVAFEFLERTRLAGNGRHVVDRFYYIGKIVSNLKRV
jgi:hypothetical protein